MRLGDYLAISGESEAAEQAFIIAVGNAVPGSRAAEVAHQMIRLAALEGDQNLFNLGIDRWRAALGEPADLHKDDGYALMAFFRGDWHDPALEKSSKDTRMQEIGIVRAWAAFERDGNHEATSALAMEYSADPMVRDQADLLRARVLAASGLSNQANSIATRARDQLIRNARTSLPDAIWLPVADWTLAVIHSSLGNHEQSRSLFGSAGQRLGKGWIERSGDTTRPTSNSALTPQTGAAP
jgi:hypothetical protein